MWDQLREDHRYSFLRELCLLITSEKQYYIMKTRHVYHYFQKKIYDDVPGGCSYDPAGEKMEITYAFAALSDIPRDMYPLYY